MKFRRKKYWKLVTMAALSLAVTVTPVPAGAGVQAESEAQDGAEKQDSMYMNYPVFDACVKHENSLSFSGNYAVILLKNDKAGISKIKLTVNGVTATEKAVDGTLVTLRDWYPDQDRDPFDLEALLGHMKGDPSQGINMDIGFEDVNLPRALFIYKPKVDMGNGETVQVKVECEDFTEAVDSVRPIQEKDEIDILQKKGVMYWPVTFSQSMKVTLYHNRYQHPEGCNDAVLCNSKKKELQRKAEYLNGYQEHNYTYYVGKGTYYLKTECVSGAEYAYTKINSTPVGAEQGPVKKSSAKTIKVGQTVRDVAYSGLEDSDAKVNHYYKFTLKKKKNVTITCTKAAEFGRLSISICKGKKEISDDTMLKKGKITKEKLSKGTYYIKIEDGGSTMGEFGFSIK